MQMVDQINCAPFGYGVEAPRYVEKSSVEDECVDDSNNSNKLVNFVVAVFNEFLHSVYI